VWEIHRHAPGQDPSVGGEGSGIQWVTFGSSEAPTHHPLTSPYCSALSVVANRAISMIGVEPNHRQTSLISPSFGVMSMHLIHPFMGMSFN
jgi:hypothetical protein